MNASPSVSAMFDSAFQNLTAPVSGGGGLTMPQVAMPTIVTPPAVPSVSAPVTKSRSMIKMGILILATLGVLAALFLMAKKRKTNHTKKKTSTRKQQKRKRDADDSEDDSDAEDAEEDSNRKNSAMTTFAPLDLPPVSFPPTHRMPLPAQQPQQQMLPPVASNIRNSKGNRASEQLLDFPPPNIDVGLGSGTPPQMRPMPPTSATLPAPSPAAPSSNFNPL